MSSRVQRWWALIALIMVGLLTFAACAPAPAPTPAAAPQAAPAKPFKVGLVHPSPVTDSWSGLAYAALQRAQKELGAEIANVQVRDPAGYEKAFSDFGSQGYNVVIGHGYQYDDAAAKVAPQFPNTYFVIVNGRSVANNLTGINTVPGYVQVMYASGAIAGKISKTKKCAVFAMELPATKLPMEGFKAGFESIPGNTCSLVILNDQNDVGAAKEAALQAIADGADILSANANLAGSGVWQAVDTAGGTKVFAVGTVSDVNNQAPKNMLFSAAQDVPTSIFKVVKAIKEGTIKPGSASTLRLENPGDELAYPVVYNPDLQPGVFTPELKAEFEGILAKIKSGEIKVPGVE